MARPWFSPRGQGRAASTSIDRLAMPLTTWGHQEAYRQGLGRPDRDLHLLYLHRLDRARVPCPLSQHQKKLLLGTLHQPVWNQIADDNDRGNVATRSKCRSLPTYGLIRNLRRQRMGMHRAQALHHLFMPPPRPRPRPKPLHRALLQKKQMRRLAIKQHLAREFITFREVKSLKLTPRI